MYCVKIANHMNRKFTSLSDVDEYLNIILGGAFYSQILDANEWHIIYDIEYNMVGSICKLAEV